MIEFTNYKLGELVEVKGGKRLPKGTSLMKQRNEHPYIRIRDFGPKKMELTEDFEYVDDETQAQISRYIVNAEDVILSIVGTIGLVAMVGDSLDQANLTENCVKFINVKEQLLSEYLYYYLTSDAGQSEIQRGIVGAVQPKLPIKNIQNFLVKLPNLDVQKKVVDILKPMDEAIAINELIIHNLHKQAMVIFEEMFGHADKNSSVGDITLNVTDGVHNTVEDDPESDFYLLSCKNIKGGKLTITDGDRRVSKEVFEKIRTRTKLEKGDVLLSSVGTIGEMLLVNFEPENFEFQRSVAILKPNQELVSSVYLYEALLSQKQEIINSGHGAVQKCVFISDILAFRIHLPEYTEMIRFTKVVEPIMDYIHILQKKNDCLNIIRDTIKNQYFDGNIEDL